jgi:soluble lytic murein transglycosylase
MKTTMTWYLLGAVGVALVGWVGANRPSGQGARPIIVETSGGDPAAIALVRSSVLAESVGDTVGARSGYLEAVPLLPLISDYLRLRAAALTSDRQEREALYMAIGTASARQQIRPLEAGVRNRLGDVAGAVALYRELGRPGEGFGLRMEAAVSGADSARILAELMHWIRDSASAAGTSGVVSAALPSSQRLDPGELLLLARAAASVRAHPSTATGYDLSRTRGARLTQHDQALWGEASFATGQYRRAAQLLRPVTTGPLHPQSMLLRGRALIRAGMPGGKAALEDLVRQYPADSISTPVAMFLLGDLARDARDLSTARQRWLALGRKFPRHALAPRARFLAGLVLYSQHRRTQAAGEWDSLFQSDHQNGDALAAGYWSGRVWDANGDTARARDRWVQITQRSRLSYYARMAHEKLGRPDTTLAVTPDSLDLPADLREAQERLKLIASTGLLPELDIENRWLASQAGDDPARLIAIGSLLREHQNVPLAAQLGWRALTHGASGPLTYGLIFPLYFETPLTEAARQQNIEPALIAALIRQESQFDSLATSRAGARGLMQLMPAVARELARQQGVEGWHADSLYGPVRNLQLGSLHLRWALKRYGGLERTLAAYNAGGSRVSQWTRLPGAEDPEVFVEWISFEETRTYVKTVLRNLAFYRELYRW